MLKCAKAAPVSHSGSFWLLVFCHEPCFSFLVAEFQWRCHEIYQLPDTRQEDAQRGLGAKKGVGVEIPVQELKCPFKSRNARALSPKTTFSAVGLKLFTWRGRRYLRKQG